MLGVVRFLVDRPAGHVDPCTTWSPYWGCGPVGDWWVFWYGTEDVDAPRKNMVHAQVALIQLSKIGSILSLTPVLEQLGAIGRNTSSRQLVPLAEAVLDELAAGRQPVVVAGVNVAPHLIQTVWPRLWPTARASLSMRTLFGPESLDQGEPPHVVVVPKEIRGRWHGHRFLDQGSRPPRAGRSPRTQLLLDFNAAVLPGDLTVLGRIERIASRLDRLHAEGANGVSDALLVARTVEAMPFDLLLPDDDLGVVAQSLTGIEKGTVGEIRAASLVSLDWLEALEGVEQAVERWVLERLPDQPTADALWIIAKHNGSEHVEWWRRAVAKGLSRGCQSKNSEWGEALWQWWTDLPTSLTQVSRHLGSAASCEEWLMEHAVAAVDDELLSAVVELCEGRDWPRLLAKVMADRPLSEAVCLLRDSTTTPGAGLDALLDGRSAREIIEVAGPSSWVPLREAAVLLTVSSPGLLARIEDQPGFLGLLRLHLERRGPWPRQFSGRTFLSRLFDGAVAGDVDALAVVGYLGKDAGIAALGYQEQDALWRAVLAHVNADFVQGAVDAWWSQFLADEGVPAPADVLRSHVLQSAMARIRRGPVTLVIGLFRHFPEASEDDLRRWMNSQAYMWAVGDHERLGQLLVERGWQAAAKAMRWSWKQELKVVAWHARELLPWYDKFWGPPDGARSGAAHNATGTSGSPGKTMKITFLASNPLASDQLALGEEARAIEQKVRSSRHRDGIQVRQRWAVRPEDLQQILLEDEPTVVHFSGHGAGAAGIVLHGGTEDEERLLDAGVLAALLRVHKQNIRVVLLNACFSEEQAKAVVNEIDFVVGMNDSIGDEAARVFAAAFYQALGFGKSVQAAFDQGVLELKLLGLDQDVDIPVLLVRDGVDATGATLVATS